MVNGPISITSQPYSIGLNMCGLIVDMSPSLSKCPLPMRLCSKPVTYLDNWLGSGLQAADKTP